MPDQDVIHDREATDAPSSGVGTNGHASDNGQAAGAPAVPGKSALLRDEFAARLAAAWTANDDVVAALGLATASMQTDGRPPSYQLIHRLGECHREFLRLRLEMTRRAQALALTVPPLDALTGLAELAGLLDSVAPPAVAVASLPPAPPVHEPSPIAAAAIPPIEEVAPAPIEPSIAPPAESAAVERIEETKSVAAAEPDPADPGDAVRRAAMAALETCLRLKNKDGTEFAPLSECQSQARALHERIAASPSSELPPEASELAGGEHPIANLLILIGGVESISDAQWAKVHARVTEAFGRQLAVSAARGRLVIGPERTS
jgi:hypothetical protein